MNEKKIRELLHSVKQNRITMDDAVSKLRELPFTELGFATVDNHRQMRTGYPEVIYCEGKTPTQVRSIMQTMLQKESNILATRADPVVYDAVKDLHENVRYNQMGRVITTHIQPVEKTDTYIAIVSAGTSDLSVVEEARETAEILGNRTVTVNDVGVAGIHRLFHKMELIQNAKVVIVVAGMEGALASVVGGLVGSLVIAVPTSVGYGASFHGVSALLTMLNSCASGVTVVNIDNGFGAAYCASIVNRG